jgi:hypothetical protein
MKPSSYQKDAFFAHMVVKNRGGADKNRRCGGMPLKKERKKATFFQT